jgi:hypothetical protein
MKCHWAEHTMEFIDKGITVADSFVKWPKGNDIWALAIVNFIDTATQSTFPEIQALLKEFADVFAKPKKLPPNRDYDHAITLVPNSIPINSRPYRYSPLHIFEIERQVQELLDASLMSHPVLKAKPNA